jgi:hypothetical protein
MEILTSTTNINNGHEFRVEILIGRCKVHQGLHEFMEEGIIDSRQKEKHLLHPCLSIEFELVNVIEHPHNVGVQDLKCWVGHYCHLKP